MNNNQTWTIGGRILTHKQVLELRNKKVGKTEEKEIGLPPGSKGEVPSDFFELKKYVAEKGMDVGKSTTKKEIMEWLAFQK